MKPSLLWTLKAETTFFLSIDIDKPSWLKKFYIFSKVYILKIPETTSENIEANNLVK